jgi:Flp pilus assembly protein TadG
MVSINGPIACLRRFSRDSRGNVMVEATVMMTIIFVFLLGGVDFLFAFYQYNAASKAVQMGARIAAVWDPVASGLSGLSASAASSGTYTAGSAMPNYSVTCNGSTSSCGTCSGYCTGVSGYSADAMAAIVCGRGATNATCSSGCPTAASLYAVGMCQLYSGIRMANVVVTYTQTVLGYVGRPSAIGGPVPTITVSLQNVPFKFFFLGGLLGFGTNGQITMPPLTTSITAEYMSSAAP